MSLVEAQKTPIRWRERDVEVDGEEYWNTRSVAEMADVHRLTIMRWERQKKITQAKWSRRVNGRRWSKEQVEEIVAYARSQRADREHRSYAD